MMRIWCDATISLARQPPKKTANTHGICSIFRLCRGGRFPIVSSLQCSRSVAGKTLLLCLKLTVGPDNIYAWYFLSIHHSPEFSHMCYTHITYSSAYEQRMHCQSTPKQSQPLRAAPYSRTALVHGLYCVAHMCTIDSVCEFAAV